MVKLRVKLMVKIRVKLMCTVGDKRKKYSTEFERMLIYFQFSS